MVFMAWARGAALARARTKRGKSRNDEPVRASAHWFQDNSNSTQRQRAYFMCLPTNPTYYTVQRSHEVRSMAQAVIFGLVGQCSSDALLAIVHHLLCTYCVVLCTLRRVNRHLRIVVIWLLISRLSMMASANNKNCSVRLDAYFLSVKAVMTPESKRNRHAAVQDGTGIGYPTLDQAHQTALLVCRATCWHENLCTTTPPNTDAMLTSNSSN